MRVVRKPAHPKARVEVSLEELVAALKEMGEEDREWFVENLLAATSPQYLESVREAREDYRAGHRSQVYRR